MEKIKDIIYTDNSSLIDLIDSPPSGLFYLIDDSCGLGK